MRVVAVTPAPPPPPPPPSLDQATQPQPSTSTMTATTATTTAMSPMAFFAENELLRRGLVALNALLAGYCLAVMLLLVGYPSCRYAAYAAFECDVLSGTTPFGTTLRRVHSVVGVYCAITAWFLAWPRRWLVRLNIVVLSLVGVALIVYGILQCLDISGRPTAAQEHHFQIIAGVEMVVLGVVSGVGGGVGGLSYDRRMVMETRVVVDFILATILTQE